MIKPLAKEHAEDVQRFAIQTANAHTDGPLLPTKADGSKQHGIRKDLLEDIDGYIEAGAQPAKILLTLRKKYEGNPEMLKVLPTCKQISAVSV